MPAESGAGFEGHKAKRFRRGGVEHAPHVDAHRFEHGFGFVDQRDVDGAKDVFEQLGGFGDFGALGRMDFVKGRLVERGGDGFRVGVEAADELGRFGDFEFAAARVFAFGRIRDKQVVGRRASGELATVMQRVAKHAARRAGIRRRLEHAQRAGRQQAADVEASLAHRGEVGAPVGQERRRHAHDRDVSRAERVGRGADLVLAGGERLRQARGDRGRSGAERRLAGGDRGGALGVGLDAAHGKASAQQARRERQTDVTLAQNRDRGSARGEFAQQRLGRGRRTLGRDCGHAREAHARPQQAVHKAPHFGGRRRSIGHAPMMKQSRAGTSRRASEVLARGPL